MGNIGFERGDAIENITGSSLHDLSSLAIFNCQEARKQRDRLAVWLIPGERVGEGALFRRRGKVAAMSEEPALEVLRRVLNRSRSQRWEHDEWDTSIRQAARADLLGRYGPMLSPEGVEGIGRETFLEFLHAQNKRHRMGLGRVGSLTVDLPLLREALGMLVDERLPLKERLDRLRPQGGKPMVDGLGPGIMTIVLHFRDPARYGIMSGTAERVLRRLGLYPDVPATASFATRYEAVNPVLLHVAAALGIDLDLLDTLWWRVQPQDLEGFVTNQTEGR